MPQYPFIAYPWFQLFTDIVDTGIPIQKNRGTLNLFFNLAAAKTTDVFYLHIHDFRYSWGGQE